MTTAIKLATATLALLGALTSHAALAQETKVKIEDVPAVVKAAIEKAVGGGRLIDIGEVTTGAKTKPDEVTRSILPGIPSRPMAGGCRGPRRG